MRQLVFARFSPLRDTYCIEALYSYDLWAIEERLQESGIRFTMDTGKVGENYISIPVTQDDVDKGIWARNIVDDCNFIDLSPDLDIHALHADAIGNVYDYAKRESRPEYITFREYAGMVILNRCIESANGRWSTTSLTVYLLDELDEHLTKYPRIAFRAFQQLHELLQNY